MKAEEAEEALKILRNVVSATKDDSALQNWGVIWILHGLANAAGFILSHVFLDSFSLLHFLALWAGILAFDFLVIAIFRKRQRGTQTFVERQLWVIWLTFIISSLAIAAINVVLELPHFHLLGVISVSAAFALTMMGALIEKVYFLPAIAFVLIGPVLAAFHEVQLVIFGITWGLLQVCMGYELHRRKRVLNRTAELV